MMKMIKKVMDLVNNFSKTLISETKEISIGGDITGCISENIVGYLDLVIAVLQTHLK